METSCEKTLSKVILYFVSIYILLITATNDLIITSNISETDGLTLIVDITSTILHGILGILLLIGVVMYKTKLVEVYTLLSTSLLIISSVGITIDLCMGLLGRTVDFSVGVLITRWVLQLFIFWAFNVMCKNDELSECDDKEEHMEKIILK